MNETRTGFRIPLDIDLDDFARRASRIIIPRLQGYTGFYIATALFSDYDVMSRMPASERLTYLQWVYGEDSYPDMNNTVISMNEIKVRFEKTVHTHENKEANENSPVVSFAFNQKDDGLYRYGYVSGCFGPLGESLVNEAFLALLGLPEVQDCRYDAMSAHGAQCIHECNANRADSWKRILGFNTGANHRGRKDIVRWKDIHPVYELDYCPSLDARINNVNTYHFIRSGVQYSNIVLERGFVFGELLKKEFVLEAETGNRRNSCRRPYGNSLFDDL